MTIAALLDLVILGKPIPMLSLIGGKNAGALAEGTNVVHGREDSRANELGPILHTPQRLAQGRIGLEGHHDLFARSGH